MKTYDAKLLMMTRSQIIMRKISQTDYRDLVFLQINSLEKQKMPESVDENKIKTEKIE